MKKTITTAATLCFAAMLLFSGCKKEVGPKGDKGDTGATGATGATGNANVQSYNFSTSAGWAWDSNLKVRYAAFSAPAITSSVLNGGAIMLYQTFSSGYQLAYPLTTLISPGVVETDYFEIGVNAITVFVSYSNGADPNPPTWNYRLVVIPPAMVKPNVNMQDYNAVKTAYQLKD